MKNKHRFAAFTIMELMVAMLISALVITITYTAYGIASRAYSSYNQKHLEMAGLIRLDELLRRDTEKATLILHGAGTLHFSKPKDTVVYRFEPDKILRVAGITDTFRVKADGLSYQFENQPLASQESIEITDEISFSVQLRARIFPYHYHKRYSAADLLNLPPHAQH
ncbi:prepilin-type N-terminal cleavage/methylation domain-containing protein [Mucilaginibacter sp. PAMB04168]|uniref:PulJ/GspJ family protein n=1 Tax=Mucilaginibacter sp. PAMB04168 TaxID=3138567 RepID=UPI0031F6CDAF